MKTSSSSRARGTEAERRARRFYRLRGYRVLGENVWVGGYELDLIVRRGSRLVFCEVKAKAGEGYGDPDEMVGKEKRRRLRRAAAAWLAGNPKLHRLQVRFDVVAVSPRGLRRIVGAFVLAALFLSVVTATADARRKPTRGERASIAKALERKTSEAPPSCFPLNIIVSTVNTSYAAGSFRANRACGLVTGNGLWILRRVRRGLWRIVREGSDIPCRTAPRGVIRDLLGYCR